MPRCQARCASRSTVQLGAKAEGAYFGVDTVKTAAMRNVGARICKAQRIPCLFAVRLQQFGAHWRRGASIFNLHEPPYGIDLNRTGFLLVSFANDQDGLRLEHALLERNAGKVRFVDGMLAPQRFHGRMSFFGTWDQFLTRLRKRQVIDVMKVDCVTCWLPEAQLQLLRELVACGALGRVRLLILVIRLDESNSLLLRDWYETLSSMFFEYSMAVYVAKQSGDCSASFGSCKYTIGFVNVNGSDHTSVRVPVAGLGSAEEELLRLHHFLSNPRHICPTTVFSVTNESCYGCESWTTCSFQGYNQQCAVLYFG
uniref:Uncharacterized protein n=1 Tax=Trichuris muris TaxID=70415 RepID=A0A5S6Q227_TRIMR